MPLLRRSSMRRRVLRGGRRVRRRVGVSRGRGVGLRSRRMSLRFYPRTESKYVDDSGQVVLSTIGPRAAGFGPDLNMTEFLLPVVNGRIIPMILSDVPQGPAATQRVGNRIMLRNLRFSCILSAAQLLGGIYDAPPITGSTTNQGAITESSGILAHTGHSGVIPQKFIRTTFRLVFVRDRMVSLTGAVPASPLPPSIDDIFEVGGGLYTTANLNITSLGRYQLLYDRKFTCDSDDPQRSLTVSIPLNAPCHFGGAGAQDVREGAVYWLAFATSAGIDSATLGFRMLPPSIAKTVRIAYTDR